MLQPVDNRAEGTDTHRHLALRVMDCLRERFVLIDQDFKIILVNEAALPNSAERRGVLGRDIFEVYPNLLQQGLKQIIEHVFKTGEPHIEFYVRHTTVDSFTGYHHRKIIPLKDTSGVIEGVIVIVENVHEERLAQLQSKHTEFEYTQLIETLQLVSFELNASGTIVEINKAVKPVLGFEQAQLLGKSFTSCIHPDDIRKTWHVYWQIVNLGKPFGVCDNRFATFDNSYVHMRWSIHPLYDDNGAIIGCRGVGENITADQTLLQELRDGLRLYEETFQAAPGPVMVIQSGEIVKINRALYRLLNISTRAKLPTLEEVAVQLHTTEMKTLCDMAQESGTARTRLRFHNKEGYHDAQIIAIRIHDAIVVAIEPMSAVQ